MPLSRITSASIDNSAISAADIADGTITAAKIISVANTQITGNIVSSQIAPSIVLNTPALGTPASGVLTNCTGVVAGALPAGSVLQVVQTVKTDTFSTTSVVPTYADVTGLSATITPTSSSSKILVFVNMVLGTSAYTAYYRLNRNSTAILFGDTAGTRATVTEAMDAGDTDSNRKQTPVNTCYLDSPATTSATTYKATICARLSGNTVYINRCGLDNNDVTFDPRATSTITVMEIAG